MSAIRFVHTDYLRLGSPINGLADGPAWFQQLTAEAVRRATCNVIETAIAQEADFLLIAGSVCETSEDLRPVATWLAEQFQLLKNRGIKIVARAQNAAEATVLSDICDVVLTDHQTLASSVGFDGRVSLAVSNHAGTTGDLVISIDGVAGTYAEKLGYNAVPALKPAEHQSSVLGAWRSISAGAVQSLNKDETWDCSCVVVDVDVADSEIRTSRVSCDVLRFTTEEVSIENRTISVSDLVAEILHASSALQRRSSQTVVANWNIKADVLADTAELSKLSEASLLAQLRQQLHGGHHGVWPQSVSFASDSVLRIANAQDTVVTHFAEMMATPWAKGRGVSRLTETGCAEISSEYLAGLELLQRVA